jgi:hypothetical protein
VLIGRVTAGSKADRLRIRQELIAAAYAKAATMPDGDAKSALIAAADRLARLNVAVEHMRLCEDSYYDDPSSPHYKPNPPEGWQRVDPPPGLVFDEGKTGFHAALYRSEIDGSYVLVFRGTDLWGNLFDPETLKDLIAGNSPIIAQYAAAIELAQQLQAIYGDQLSLAGDSLGGGLATAAAMKTGLHANVFNSVGVNEATWLGHLLNPLDTDNIDSYRVRGEILALLGLAGHPLGNQYPLSPVGGPGVGDRDPRRDPSTGVEWPDRFSPGGVISALAQAAVRATKAELAEAANRHIPETVIDSIEAQKNAAIATINAGIAP